MQTAQTNRIHTSTALSLIPRNATMVDKGILAVAASIFVALCAHVSVPLPFTPVPLTFGNMAVVLVGLCLGPSTAFAAMVLYLCEGAAGLPVFNPGVGGVAQLLGPTAGFLFAYPFAAFLAGAIAKYTSGVVSRFAAGLLGSALGTVVVLTCGVARLALFPKVTLAQAFLLGAAPFLAGEIVKILASAGIFSSMQRWRRA
jgi:biotin transport system substrate-specific component